MQNKSIKLSALAMYQTTLALGLDSSIVFHSLDRLVCVSSQTLKRLQCCENGLVTIIARSLQSTNRLNSQKSPKETDKAHSRIVSVFRIICAPNVSDEHIIFNRDTRYQLGQFARVFYRSAIWNCHCAKECRYCGPSKSPTNLYFQRFLRRDFQNQSKIVF